MTIPLRSADLDDDVAGSLALGDRREFRGRLFKVEHGGHIDADCPGCGVTEQVCMVSLTGEANTPEPVRPFAALEHLSITGTRTRLRAEMR